MKNIFKVEGTVILGNSPKSLIPPLVVAPGGLLQAKLVGLGRANKTAA